ncbi:myosin-9 [Nematostella vectensis]|uniref:myosin-9 n=1 Tax=Nematostella vectensis TaxID=45351 RepID=UPI0013900484|nr:myosin-9 [Nematostella vectensis]
MSGIKRSGIPVLGAKSSIPTVKKQREQSTTRNTKTTAKSGIPSPGNSIKKSPIPTQRIGSIASSEDEIARLQQQIAERDEALREMSIKFAKKSEECSDLLDERDAVRRRNSMDLQQVTKDYDELQQKLKDQQKYIADMEAGHAQEKEGLQLELDIMKGEHEMEITMLKKEIQAERVRLEQRKAKLDVADDASDTSSRGPYPAVEAIQEQMSSLQANYEEEIQTVKEQLQEQMLRANEAVEKYEQQEYQFHENLNELKNTFAQEQEMMREEHQREMSTLRVSYEERLKLQEERHHLDQDMSSPRSTDSAVKALKEENEAYIEALKEQYSHDLEDLKQELSAKDEEILQKEAQMEDDLLLMRNEYESQVSALRAEIERTKESGNAALKDAMEELQKYKAEVTEKGDLEEIRAQHMKEIEEMQVLQCKEIEDIKATAQSRDSGDGSVARKESLENVAQLKQQLQAYEHEIRNLKAELKNQKHGFTECKQSLESAITVLEGRIKEREEQVRNELHEEHQYLMENLKKEHFEEVENLKHEHAAELDHLHETLESVQMENGELQTEFDLVVSDLNSELENNKLKARVDRRRGSGILKEQIDKLKDTNVEYVHNLQDEIERYKSKINDLEKELELKTSEKQNVDYHEKIAELEKLVQSLDARPNNTKELEEYKAECEILQDEVAQYRRLSDEDRHRLDEYKAFAKQLQDNLDKISLEKLQQSQEHSKKISDLVKQLHSFNKEKEKERKKWKDELTAREKEITEIKKMNETLTQQENDNKKKINNLDGLIGTLNEDKKRLELENQKLRVDVEEAWNAQRQESESLAADSFVVSEENTDLIRDDAPLNTEQLRYDQGMKGVVEELENKLSKLQEKLEQSNQQLAAKSKRIESLNAEMGVLRENLEDERTVVQNLEDRIGGLIQKHDVEINQLKEKAKEHQASTDEDASAITSKLRHDLEESLRTNSKKTEEVLELQEKLELIQQEFHRRKSLLLKEQSKSSELEKKVLELENQLNFKIKELEVFELEQIEHEASSVAEELKKTSLIEQSIDKLERDLRLKDEELAKVTQNRVAFEANSLAQQLKEKQAYEVRIETLENNLLSKTAEMDNLLSKIDTERSEHTRKVAELDSLVVQLKRDDSEGKQIQELVNEMQTSKAEVEALNSTLASERIEHSKLSKNFEKEKGRMEAEVKSLTEMIEKERNGHAQKRGQLEREIDKGRAEIKELGSLLETEQSSHEKTIKDTQKHLSRMDRADKENSELKQELALLKTKLKKVKEELARQREQNTDLLSRSQKMMVDELEVQKLNNSLTEAEIHKGKLLGEVESTRQEHQKMQEKYSKVKDKLLSTKQKWREDHQKLESLLTSPRVDMGLQTSIIDTSVVDEVSSQLSMSRQRNEKLEEELKDTKEDVQRRRSDMSALKRANDVLIKQNQTLYLETESLKATINELSEKSAQLREVSIHLTKENEKLTTENDDIKTRLEHTEKELRKTEGERSSVYALNESSRSELEEFKNMNNNFKDENDRLKNQNDFLLSQGKRLQARVDELEQELGKVKSLLVEKQLKKEIVVESISKTSDINLESFPNNDIQPLNESLMMQQNVKQMQELLNIKDMELRRAQEEKQALVDGFSQEKNELASQLQTLKNPIESSTPRGGKGYVGIKSYQVIEWDRQHNPTPPAEVIAPVTSPDVSVARDPIQGLQVAKAKELDFDTSDYLGSAYWEAMSFLKTMAPDK